MLKTFVIPYPESFNRSTDSSNLSQRQSKLASRKVIQYMFMERAGLLPLLIPAFALAFLDDSGSDESRDLDLTCRRSSGLGISEHSK